MSKQGVPHENHHHGFPWPNNSSSPRHQRAGGSDLKPFDAVMKIHANASLHLNMMLQMVDIRKMNPTRV
jgi:hypothetical protein